MMAKHQAGSLVICILIFMVSLPVARATSNDTLSNDGPSLEETLAFIKDTWEACSTMHSGLQRMMAKDGSLWHMDRMAKVEVVILPPSALKVVTRLNELRKLSGIFALQSPTERIQEFDLNALSPNVNPGARGREYFWSSVTVCPRRLCNGMASVSSDSWYTHARTKNWQGSHYEPRRPGV